MERTTLTPTPAAPATTIPAYGSAVPCDCGGHAPVPHGSPLAVCPRCGALIRVATPDYGDHRLIDQCGRWQCACGRDIADRYSVPGVRLTWQYDGAYIRAIHALHVADVALGRAALEYAGGDRHAPIPEMAAIRMAVADAWAECEYRGAAMRAASPLPDPAPADPDPDPEPPAAPPAGGAGRSSDPAIDALAGTTAHRRRYGLADAIQRSRAAIGLPTAYDPDAPTRSPYWAPRSAPARADGRPIPPPPAGGSDTDPIDVLASAAVRAFDIGEYADADRYSVAADRIAAGTAPADYAARVLAHAARCYPEIPAGGSLTLYPIECPRGCGGVAIAYRDSRGVSIHHADARPCVPPPPAGGSGTAWDGDRARCRECGRGAIGGYCPRHEPTMYDGLPDDRHDAIAAFERRMAAGADAWRAYSAGVRQYPPAPLGASDTAPAPCWRCGGPVRIEDGVAVCVEACASGGWGRDDADPRRATSARARYYHYVNLPPPPPAGGAHTGRVIRVERGPDAGYTWHHCPQCDRRILGRGPADPDDAAWERALRAAQDAHDNACHPRGVAGLIPLAARTAATIALQTHAAVDPDPVPSDPDVQSMAAYVAVAVAATQQAAGVARTWQSQTLDYALARAIEALTQCGRGGVYGMDVPDPDDDQSSALARTAIADAIGCVRTAAAVAHDRRLPALYAALDGVIAALQRCAAAAPSLRRDATTTGDDDYDGYPPPPAGGAPDPDPSPPGGEYPPAHPTAWTPPTGGALCGLCALYGIRTAIPHADAAPTTTLHRYGETTLCARIALCPDCHDAAGDADAAEDGCRECAAPTALYIDR